MKIRTLLIISLFSLVFSCSKENKTEDASGNNTENVAEDKTETLVQPEVVMVSDEGNQVKVIYFAEGNQVAVKITKGNEAQKTFHALGSSEKGNPIFSDGKNKWEITGDGASGILTEENGTKTIYKKQ